MTRLHRMMIALVAVGTLVSAGSAHAQQQPPPASSPDTGTEAEAPRWHPMIETDTLIYAFAPLRGFQLIVGVQPAPLPRWDFKAVVLSFPAPSAMLGEENAGFDVRQFALGLIAHYHLLRERGGLVLGPVLAVQSSTFTRGDAPGEVAKTLALSAGAQVGYQWLPFERIGLYVLPNVGVTATLPLQGDPTVGGRTFHTSPVGPLLGLHIGYEF